MKKRLNCNALASIIFVAIIILHTIYIATIKLGSNSSSTPHDKHVVYEAEFLPIKSQRQILDEQIASYPRQPPQLFNVRSIDETKKLPQHKCGIIFFYHIACTGGSAINKWLERAKKYNNNTTYFTDWGRHMGVQKRFVTKMERQVRNFAQYDWRIVHAHGFSLHLNTSEPYLYKWREEVERQGCAFVVTTMLRDAIGHTISQHKGMILYNQTVDEFTEYLEPQNYNKVGHFRTQLDYFLYNGDRNKYNATTIEKVTRAIEILCRHFDIVLLSDHDRYSEIIYKITGWEGKSIRRSNTFKGELNFTERELYRIKTLTEMNGDVMFIDAVKHIYYGYLDYLVASENNDIDNNAVIDVAKYDGTFPILPINQRKLAVRNNTSGPAGVRDVLQSLFSLAMKRRKVDETKLPYQCGVILYNHNIPGQDGHKLNEWIHELVQSNSGSSFITSDEHISKSIFLQTVEKRIQNLSGANDWIIIHSNNNGLTFATDEHILHSWRDIVNKQQSCHFITTAIFVDPLEHSIKHTKERFADCNCTVVDYYDTMSTVNDDGVRETLGNRDYESLLSNAWIGQLDHFLFKSNNVTKKIETKDKIILAMNVLIEYFDIVLVDGNVNFSDELLKITGWSTDGHHLEKTPVCDKGGLLYTKELISAFGKISTKNGDADFIDAVNHVYHNSLEYLMLQ